MKERGLYMLRLFAQHFGAEKGGSQHFYAVVVVAFKTPEFRGKVVKDGSVYDDKL